MTARVLDQTGWIGCAWNLIRRRCARHCIVRKCERLTRSNLAPCDVAALHVGGPGSRPLRPKFVLPVLMSCWRDGRLTSGGAALLVDDADADAGVQAVVS